MAEREGRAVFAPAAEAGCIADAAAKRGYDTRSIAAQHGWRANFTLALNVSNDENTKGKEFVGGILAALRINAVISEMVCLRPVAPRGGDQVRRSKSDDG